MRSKHFFIIICFNAIGSTLRIIYDKDDMQKLDLFLNRWISPVILNITNIISKAVGLIQIFDVSKYRVTHRGCDFDDDGRACMRSHLSKICEMQQIPDCS